MQYNETRTKIKSGDILAWSHVGWSSWNDIQVQAVRAFTRSEYSHVGVAWVTSGRVFIIEAVVPQIRIFPLSKKTPFYWIPTASYWTPEIEEYALSKVGAPYSKWEAIKGFLEKVNIGDNAVWQCAEFVNSLLIKANYFPTNIIATPTKTVEAMQIRNCPVYLVEN